MAALLRNVDSLLRILVFVAGVVVNGRCTTAFEKKGLLKVDARIYKYPVLYSTIRITLIRIHENTFLR